MTVKVGKVEVDREWLARVCKKWRLREIAVFGSVTRDDFDEESDVDLRDARSAHVSDARSRTSRHFCGVG
jgi:predicted nucleotidyltransferase